MDRPNEPRDDSFYVRRLTALLQEHFPDRFLVVCPPTEKKPDTFSVARVRDDGELEHLSDYAGVWIRSARWGSGNDQLCVLDDIRVALDLDLEE